MFDDDVLAQWTKKAQEAFPGCKVEEWDDRCGGITVGIVDAQGELIRELWDTPDDRELAAAISYRLFMTVVTENRQQPTKTRKHVRARRLAKAK